jgi:GT2 family glycosyltransferase
LSKARNIGFSKSLGKYCLVLDNDTVWLDNAAKYLGDFLDLQKDAGIAGMCAVYLPTLTSYVHVHNDFVIEPTIANATNTYCMMIRHNLIDQGIKFDENFNKIQGEDIDLCIQAELKGFINYALPHVPLIHSGHGSLEIYRDVYRQLMYENHKYIEKKWMDKYNPDNKFIWKSLMKFINQKTALALTLSLEDINFFDILNRSDL